MISRPLLVFTCLLVLILVTGCSSTTEDKKTGDSGSKVNTVRQRRQADDDAIQNGK
jgi:outer membrane biogenesis lipoprotein LolB